MPRAKKAYHGDYGGGRNGAFWTNKGEYRLARRYTQIPNQLVDEWTRHIISELGASHIVVLMVIDHLTLGREKPEDQVSLASMVRLSGLCRERVREILADLIAMGVVVREARPGRKPVMGLDLEWRPTTEAMARGRRSRDERVRRKSVEGNSDNAEGGGDPHTGVGGPEDDSESDNRSTTDSRLPAHCGVPVDPHTVADDMRIVSPTTRSLESRGRTADPKPGVGEKKRNFGAHSVAGENAQPDLFAATRPRETGDDPGVSPNGHKRRHPNHHKTPGRDSATGAENRNNRARDDDRKHRMGPSRRSAKSRGTEGGDDPWRTPWSSLPGEVGAAEDAAPSNHALADAHRWAARLGVEDDAEALAALEVVAEHVRGRGERAGARIESAMRRCSAAHRAGEVKDLVLYLAEAVRAALAGASRKRRGESERERERRERIEKKEKELMKNGPRLEDNREAISREYGIMWG